MRRAAVDALRDMGSPAAQAAPPPGSGGALRDESPWVRRQAAEALGTVAVADGGAVEALALRRIGTPEATGALLDYLTTARWCPTTTPQSRY
jgi:HEAT repeat protein